MKLFPDGAASVNSRGIVAGGGTARGVTGSSVSRNAVSRKHHGLNGRTAVPHCAENKYWYTGANHGQTNECGHAIHWSDPKTR